MRRILFVLPFLLPVLSSAQNQIGWSGNGFFENLEDSALSWLKAYHTPFTIRFPGGPISKFCNPYAIRQGWGIDTNMVNAFYATGGVDEDGDSKDKWIGKAGLQPLNSSYMDELSSLVKTMPMEVLWVANINLSAHENEKVIDYMIDSGVKIVGVVMGSEVYSWLNFSFSAYEKKFEPIVNEILKNHPTLKIALCVAPNPKTTGGSQDKGRVDHALWNDSVGTYMNSDTNYKAIDIHLYYGGTICPDIFNLAKQPGKRVMSGQDDTELTHYFTDAYNCLMSSTSVIDRITYCRTKFKNKEVWNCEGLTCTPSYFFGNTWVNGALQFKAFLDVNKLLDRACKQSLVTPDIHGDICRRNDFDLVQTTNVKRIGYFSTLLYTEAIIENAIHLTDTVINLTTDSENYFFYSLEKQNIHLNIPSNKFIEAVNVKRVTGLHPYSSSGAMAYMAKKSTQSYEIDKVIVESIDSDYFSIPANSFGLVEIKLSTRTSLENRNTTLNHIRVFPSPAKDLLYIQQENCRGIEIRDLMGRLILSCTPEKSLISVSELKTGIYFLTNGIDVTKFEKD